MSQKNNSQLSLNSRKSRLSLGAIFLLGGAGVLWLFLSKQNIGSTTNLPQETESSQFTSTEDSQTSKTPEQYQESVAVNPGANKESVAGSGKAMKHSAPAISVAPFSEQLKRQIIRFKNLQMKSVMTEAEQNEYSDMLQNADVLHQIGEVLRSRKAFEDPQFAKLENVAVDYVIEALKKGNEDAASDAAWDQIRDAQVEDPSIPLGERKILAGIKGEILYHATAIRPDIFQEVEMDLPGPASEKIWQNVQAQHQDNLKDSQSEVNEYELEQQQKSEED